MESCSRGRSDCQPLTRGREPTACGATAAHRLGPVQVSYDSSPVKQLPRLSTPAHESHVICMRDHVQRGMHNGRPEPSTSHAISCNLAAECFDCITADWRAMPRIQNHRKPCDCPITSSCLLRPEACAALAVPRRGLRGPFEGRHQRLKPKPLHGIRDARPGIGHRRSNPARNAGHASLI